MATITLSDILDDLEAAEQGLRKFERRYWMSSSQFYDLYSQGLLDDGSHAEDFAEWAGHYKLKLKREAALEQLSRQRVEQLRRQASGETIELAPEEPVLDGLSAPRCLRAVYLLASCHTSRDSVFDAPPLHQQSKDLLCSGEHLV